MEYRPELFKVRLLLRDRFEKIYNSHGRPWHETQFKQVQKEWTLYCSEIGIDRVGSDAVDEDGLSTRNNRVAFQDPCCHQSFNNLEEYTPPPGGRTVGAGDLIGWLEMSEETFQKFLVLGIP